MDSEVSFIIPAKNEEKTIGPLVSALLDNYPDSEVVVVDDGSSDGTAMISSEAGAKVVSHPYSKGNGAAIKTGARCAKGTVFVFMDADGQHDVADVGRLIVKFREGYDLVVGARGAKSQASWGRGLANSIYNQLATYMVGQKVSDLTSGFRIVKSDLFLSFINLLPNGFSYPTTSTMAFFRAGYSVGFVPIEVKKREGKSHIRIMRDGIRFLLIIFKIGTLYSPLKIFFPFSLVIFSVGLAYYGYTFFTSDRFTNMSALLFTTSIVVFLMGLISEQITQLMYKDCDQNLTNDGGN